jgi:uncharacterized membrane protein
MNWKYFIAACFIIGAALLKAGAPPLTIIAGITFAALFNAWRHRGNSARVGSTVTKAR